ncbi:MAG: hypothetical protein WC749_00265 [Dehalococcoidia bacterium]|uniref:hypothetical protein n=1 Tax=unclassified Pseudomonas TaxID=196821 RepID=UPI001472BBDF|nr:MULTISPECIES: hypothetical protein [unclassified Pseudomonas]NMX92614.1 hypothetical protein [Pseudomonas sp. WS 5086]NMY47107.1 hypothetical protein [Pseudomonas sp. WS 5027]
MPVTTRKQRDAYADVRESLENEGYTSGDMMAQTDIREALLLMAAEGERLTAFAQDLAARLDEADEEAALDAEDSSHG